MFRQAGVIQVDTLDEMFDVAQLLAHQPLPRGRRVAVVGNSDALGLLAADAAAAVGLVVNPLGRARRRRRPPRTSRTPSTPPSTTPRSTRWSRSTSRRSTSRRRGRRQRARRGGGAVRQADRLDVPRRRGRPRAAAGPRRRRLHAPGAARCRPTPPSRPPCGRSRASSSTPCGCARPTARRAVPGDGDPRRGQAAGQRDAHDSTPRARDLDCAERAALLAAYGIDLWEPAAVATLERGDQAAGEELGWDVVLKATAERLRDRPDLAHVWRNIDTAGGDGRRLGDAQRADRRPRHAPASWCSGTPRPACRWRSAAWRTRCSARSCRSASPGR